KARAQLLERAREIGLGRAMAADGFQILDEQPQLALLDGDRTLDGEQAIADQRRSAVLVGQRLQLQADTRQRLQHAVVKIARDADPIFADRDLLQPIVQIQLLERVADLARY